MVMDQPHQSKDHQRGQNEMPPQLGAAVTNVAHGPPTETKQEHRDVEDHKNDKQLQPQFHHGDQGQRVQPSMPKNVVVRDGQAVPYPRQAPKTTGPRDGGHHAGGNAVGPPWFKNVGAPSLKNSKHDEAKKQGETIGVERNFKRVPMGRVVGHDLLVGLFFGNVVAGFPCFCSRPFGVAFCLL